LFIDAVKTIRSTTSSSPRF